MILVTGATGQLGAAVVRQLLARTDPANIAVLVRDPGKAADLARRGVSVRLGEYGDPGSLARAMEGVDRVLLIASSEFQQRVQQHQNVIDAAQAAGVGLLGFTSRSLSEISGSTVSYTSVSDGDFVAHAVELEIPDQLARQLAGFFADVRDNQLDETSTDLQPLLGRAPASLKDGLAELFALPISA